MDPNTKSWCGNEAGLSASGDSFYEYLLKEWIRTDHKDVKALELYKSSLESFLKVGLFHKSPQHNLLYVGNYKYGTISNSMSHLACFVGKYQLGFFLFTDYHLNINKWEIFVKTISIM